MGSMASPVNILKPGLLMGAWVLAACLLGGGSALARQAPVDTSRIGPQVGARAPEFTGTDYQSRTHTLQSLMGREGLMLVFSRSADW